MKNYISNENTRSITLSGEAPLYIISDIHANLPAFQAVLNEIPAGSDIICLGDMVGYYTEPNEVCDLLRTRNIFCILGNHDMYVTQLIPYNKDRDSLYRTSWTVNTLTDENMGWLRKLPASIIIHVGHEDSKIKTVVSHHGDFNNPEKYIYPDTEFNCEIFGTHTLGLLGNTHHPMIRHDATNYLLNPGSVGQPRDWNPAASFAVVDLINADIHIHRVKYDVQAYQEKLKLQGLEPQAIEILSRVR